MKPTEQDSHQQLLAERADLAASREMRVILGFAAEEFGWTQADLANALGIKQQSLEAYYGTKNPRAFTLAKTRAAMQREIVVGMNDEAAPDHAWETVRKVFELIEERGHHVMTRDRDALIQELCHALRVPPVP